ncbi:MAG: class I SAM-dependent methyltransferase [Helicobacteraceae bacterium]|jgi:ubiquinone/menaquinone biosynthesis C-methylase UbiE|nr:class I SAM-dependent methyltransferase [Helicobacteraceae bacterium]
MSRFDKAAKEWDGSQLRQMLAFDIAKGIIESHPLTKEMKILDFGAGTGLLSKHLCAQVGHLTALDISKGMLEQLKENASAWDTCDVETVHKDILDYTPTEPFDGVVSSMSMHHIEDIDRLFQTFATILKPKGFIAIADLEVEDGSFHEYENEGVYHFGFEEEALTQIARKHGFTSVSFQTVHCVRKEDNREYQIFLMNAQYT